MYKHLLYLYLKYVFSSIFNRLSDTFNIYMDKLEDVFLEVLGLLQILVTVTWIDD
jgi:hypothetical protein